MSVSYGSYFFTLLTINKILKLKYVSEFLSKTDKYCKFSFVSNYIM